jgi:hypothetical protein
VLTLPGQLGYRALLFRQDKHQEKTVVMAASAINEAAKNLLTADGASKEVKGADATVRVETIVKATPYVHKAKRGSLLGALWSRVLPNCKAGAQ